MCPVNPGVITKHKENSYGHEFTAWFTAKDAMAMRCVKKKQKVGDKMQQAFISIESMDVVSFKASSPAARKMLGEIADKLMGFRDEPVE
jgi:hypothetical protein